MSPKTRLLWIVLLLSLSSCVSYEKYSMEVFKPGERSFPENMHKIALVARNLKYKADTLQNYQAKNYRLIKDRSRFNVDSLAISTCMDTLEARLLEQPQFDSVLVLPFHTFPVTRVNEIRPAKTGWYRKLADQTGADGLIVLDMFSCFYSVTHDNMSANVVTSNIWSVYNNRSEMIDRYTQIDTLYWDQSDADGSYKKYKIPDKKSAVAMAAGVIGENYSKRFLPAWTTVYRDIMTCSNPDLKIAANLAGKNKWDEASVIWNKYANASGKRNQLIAKYNLALACEMNGNVDRALELIAESALLSSGAFRSAENELIRKYAVVLERRKNEIKKLNAQQ